jgi:hypothetical protein
VHLASCCCVIFKAVSCCGVFLCILINMHAFYLQNMHMIVMSFTIDPWILVLFFFFSLFFRVCFLCFHACWFVTVMLSDLKSYLRNLFFSCWVSSQSQNPKP